MDFSSFGSKFGRASGIVNLMDDLHSAVEQNPEMIAMGGGNPGRIREVETFFQRQLESILENPEDRHRLFGAYQSPQGDPAFRHQLASFLNDQFGWTLSAQNIAVSNGSQSAFFILFNLFAGVMPEGENRAIHLPLSPEYVGYNDIGLSEGFFSATPPTIEHLDNNLFKYRLDFDAVRLDEHVGALCVSRPTNPTGNVLTDDEVLHLDHIARARQIPLIIDGAYGLPFPNILFTEAQTHWNENIILVLSLSKLGLPGIRTGIVIAREEIIEAYSNANTIVSLASGTLGPALAKSLFASGKILSLTQDHITPYYRHWSAEAVAFCHQALQGLPYRIHKPEGAIFLWLWFENLPISSQDLYQRLKRRGVLVVPGHNFFIGIEDGWRHKHECIRVSYAHGGKDLRKGIDLIAAEVRLAYGE